MAKSKNTYSWNCRTVDCYPTFEDNSDVVYNVHWRINATSDQVDSDDNPYTATTMGEEKVAELKSGLDAQIESKINPTSVTLEVSE